jgi:hypothetical protein
MCKGGDLQKLSDVSGSEAAVLAGQACMHQNLGCVSLVCPLFASCVTDMCQGGDLRKRSDVSGSVSCMWGRCNLRFGVIVLAGRIVCLQDGDVSETASAVRLLGRGD